jgi:hypothetical protein
VIRSGRIVRPVSTAFAHRKNMKMGSNWCCERVPESIKQGWEGGGLGSERGQPGKGKGSTRSFAPLCAHGCGDPAHSAEFDDLAPGLKFRHDDARELSSTRLQQHLLQPADGPPGTSRSLQHHVVRLVCHILDQYFPRAHVWELPRSCTAGKSGDRLPRHPPRPSKCAKMAQSVCQAGTARGKRFDARRRHGSRAGFRVKATLRPPSGLLVANR